MGNFLLFKVSKHRIYTYVWLPLYKNYTNKKKKDEAWQNVICRSPWEMSLWVLCFISPFFPQFWMTYNWHGLPLKWGSCIKTEGTPIAFAAYIHLPFFRLLNLHLSVKNKTLLILISGCSLGVFPWHGDVVAMGLWSTQSRGESQKLCWQSRNVFPLDLSWEDVKPGHAAHSFNVKESLSEDGPYMGENTAERQKESFCLQSPDKVEAESGHIPRLFIYFSYHFLFVYSVCFGPSCNHRSH